METVESPRPVSLPWPPILIAAVLLGGVLLGLVRPLPWPGLSDLPARIVGYGLGLAGLALAAWGLITLSRAGTTVLPHKRAARLVTEGAFAFRRNPIYMGEVLMLLGLAELTHNVWFVVLAPLFALALYKLAIVPEERHLHSRFGQAYADYKTHTRCWF
jgi:protein-S-isoprenylcysteine O-methyltransferase Ste14